MSVHPKLAAALKPFEPGKVLAIALGARAAADEGRYCECLDPEVTGYDLMCSQCLLNNQDQERRRLIHLFGPHPFELDESREAAKRMGWCWCTHPEDYGPHRGEARPAVTTWGERILPPYPAHLIGPG